MTMTRRSAVSVNLHENSLNYKAHPKVSHPIQDFIPDTVLEKKNQFVRCHSVSYAQTNTIIKFYVFMRAT